jgi:hypothetical protein
MRTWDVLNERLALTKLTVRRIVGALTTMNRRKTMGPAARDRESG